MAVQVITIEDLNEFRNLLLNDLKEIIQSKPQQTKQINQIKFRFCLLFLIYFIPLNRIKFFHIIISFIFIGNIQIYALDKLMI